MFWEPKLDEMTTWLRETRGFSKNGARKAAVNFVETMAFVARETGKPMLKEFR